MANRSDVPAHLVGLVAALAGPAPADPAYPPDRAAELWLRQCRRVAAQVWAEGWVAGGAAVLAEVADVKVFIPAPAGMLTCPPQAAG